MKKNLFLALCTSCWQITTDCTCPAREQRQRLIEQALRERAERKARQEVADE